MGEMSRARLAAASVIGGVICAAMIGSPGVGRRGHPSGVQPIVGSPPAKRLFSPPVGVPAQTGKEPTGIGSGDFNHDGLLDLVTANQRSGDVTLLLGKGGGAFVASPGSPIPTGPTTSLVAVGDIDEDGNDDVVVGRHDSFEVALLLGDGRGGLRPAPRPSLRATRGPRPHCHGLLLIDLDADRHLDLVAPCADGDNVSVLLGDGRGGFSPVPGSPFPAGRHPYGVAAADLDGDGRPDLALPNLQGAAVTVLLGDGAGRFRAGPGSPHPVLSRPGFVGIGDCDGDGRKDLVITHDDQRGIVVLLGDGRGGFRPALRSPFDSGRTGFGLALADADGDGKADLVLGHARSNLVSVLLGGGDGLAPAAGPPFETGRDPNAALLADVTGDGRVDLITANYVSGDVRVLPQD
jgi:FG-GAP-like repeat